MRNRVTVIDMRDPDNVTIEHDVNAFPPGFYLDVKHEPPFTGNPPEWTAEPRTRYKGSTVPETVPADE